MKANVRAVTGTASSAFVVGSAGMPAEVVLTDDGSAGPTTAPATGLGGAPPDGSWLLILGSSLLGGTIGGASYFLGPARTDARRHDGIAPSTAGRAARGHPGRGTRSRRHRR